VTGNVIDGNGEGIIFGGGESVAARDYLVEGNVISNSRIRSNVEWHFDGPVGRDNLLRRNCIGGGIRDDGDGGIMKPASATRRWPTSWRSPSSRAGRLPAEARDRLGAGAGGRP
jgi:hypothetical protein